MQAFKYEEQTPLLLVEREWTLFEAIDKLTSHGINSAIVKKKLQVAGIFARLGLIMHPKKGYRRLKSRKGLWEAKVDKICEGAEKILMFGCITGSDVLLGRKAVVRITTGSQALDELLGGGIETLKITKAFGEFRSGITQLAHTLCVSTQLPTNMKGGNGKVAYIDTEGTFKPDLIVPIAQRFGMDAGAVLENILYARAYTYEQVDNILLSLTAKMPFKLLIVNSVVAPLRVDSSQMGELAERQQKLAQMLSHLRKIAKKFDVAVYITNQVTSSLVNLLIADPGGSASLSTVRLVFRKGKGEKHVCKFFDAPNPPKSKAIFQITAGGISDAKD